MAPHELHERMRFLDTAAIQIAAGMATRADTEIDNPRYHESIGEHSYSIAAQLLKARDEIYDDEDEHRVA